MTEPKTKERPKSSNLGAFVSVLKYLISLLQHLSKLYCYLMRKCRKKMKIELLQRQHKESPRLQDFDTLPLPFENSLKSSNAHHISLTVTQNVKYGELWIMDYE